MKKGQRKSQDEGLLPFYETRQAQAPRTEASAPNQQSAFSEALAQRRALNRWGLYLGEIQAPQGDERVDSRVAYRKGKYVPQGTRLPSRRTLEAMYAHYPDLVEEIMDIVRSRRRSKPVQPLLFADNEQGIPEDSLEDDDHGEARFAWDGPVDLYSKKISEEAAAGGDTTNKKVGSSAEIVVASCIGDCIMFKHHLGKGDIGTVITVPGRGTVKFRVEIKASASRGKEGSQQAERWLVFESQMEKYKAEMSVVQGRIFETPPVYYYGLLGYDSSIVNPDDDLRYRILSRMPHAEIAGHTMSQCRSLYLIDAALIYCFAKILKSRDFRDDRKKLKKTKEKRKFVPLTEARINDYLAALRVILGMEPGSTSVKPALVTSLRDTSQELGIDLSKMTMHSIPMAGISSDREPMKIAGVPMTGMGRIVVVGCDGSLNDALYERVHSRVNSGHDLSSDCLKDQREVKKQLFSLGLLRQY